MTEDPQFDLDTDLLGTDPEPNPELESAPPAQAAPVVMIQYRNRGVPPILLFPITLIISLGMFAAYHYLFIAPRQRELQEQARMQARAASSKLSARTEPAEPEPPSMGLSLDSQPLPPGFQISLPPPSFKDSESTRVAAKPVDEAGSGSASPESSTPKVVTPPTADATAVAEPRKEAAPPAIGFSPPSDVATIDPPKPIEKADDPPTKPAPASEVAEEKPAVAAAEPKPSPTRDEMMRALEAEAEANRAARAEQNIEKDQARARVEVEAQERVDAERELFHDGLRRIIAAGGPTSDVGQQIDALCDQFGRTYGDDLKAQVLGALSRFHGKISPENEVNMLRSLGVPEAGILDYLANTLEHRSLNARNGPRTPDGVRILAAKQLLRAKLPAGVSRAGVPAPTPAPAPVPDRIRRTRPASSVGTRPAR